MADQKDIAKIVTLLSAAYPNWNLTEYTVEVYYMDLRDIPAEELMVASQHCRSEAGRKFAPSVGELRGAVMELRRAAASTPNAYEAWQSFMKYVNGGFDVSLHPLTRKTVDALGENNLRMSTNQTADRMRFVECYEQLLERAEKEEMLIPEVRRYIESNSAKTIDAQQQIKQLAKGMTK